MCVIITLVRTFAFVLWLLCWLTLPAGAVTLENKRGGLYVRGQAKALPIVGSTIDLQIRGDLLEGTVKQSFENREDRAIEAVYIFPLPVDAIVTHLALSVGARTTIARLEKRKDARDRYETSVRSGNAAALLERERDDIFTVAVTGIAPGATVEVVLSFDCRATQFDEELGVVIPLVVGPKQTPGTPTGKPTLGTGAQPDTSRAPDASRITPLATTDAAISTTFRVEWQSAVTDVRSPSHDLLATVSRSGAKATLVDSLSNRDFVLRWKGSRDQAIIESDIDGGYAAVVVAPVLSPPQAQRVAIIVDDSARLGRSVSLHAAELLAAVVARLPAKSEMRMFSSLSGEWQQATKRVDWESQITQKRGKVDLANVLRSAIASGATSVLLVSDGLHANTLELTEVAASSKIPINVVGSGDSPQWGLLQQLASQSNGVLRVMPIAANVPLLASEVASDVATLSTMPAIDWGSRAAEQAPLRIPRVGVHQRVVVAARLASGTIGQIRVDGKVITATRLTPTRGQQPRASRHGAVARQWARSRINDLLAARSNQESTSELALRYGVLSSELAFVAVSDVVTAPGGTTNSLAIPVVAPTSLGRDVLESTQTTSFTTESKTPPPVTAKPGAGATTPDQVVTIDADLDGADDERLGHRVESLSTRSIAFATRSRYSLSLRVGVYGDTRQERLEAMFAGGLAVDHGVKFGNTRFVFGAELGIAAFAPGASVTGRTLFTFGMPFGRVRVWLGAGPQYETGTNQGVGFAWQLGGKFAVTRNYGLDIRLESVHSDGLSTGWTLGAFRRW